MNEGTHDMKDPGTRRYDRQSTCVWIKHAEPKPSSHSQAKRFHMRGLRYMLKIDSSYYSHISNEGAIRRAIVEPNGEESLNMS